MTIRKSAIEALDENHLWPLMTYVSPSLTARVRRSVGSEPAASGSVIEKADFRSPASRGASQRSCSLTRSWSGAMARSSCSTSRSSVSSGRISSRTKSRIHSSLSWNSGSVEKSHAMARSSLF
jgi:hypothetical protein